MEVLLLFDCAAVDWLWSELVVAAVVSELTEVELDEPTTTGEVAVVVLMVVVSVAAVLDDRVL
jgi:hypothetical protein